MDLELELTRNSLTGRAARPVSAEVLRPLNEADLALLQRERGIQPAPIRRLSQRHHSLARLLALGMPPGEAAIVTGYEPSRVSILQGDPTFQELLRFYSGERDAAIDDLSQRLSGLSVDAVEELRRRLEEDPESLSTNALIEITKMSADRTGYGPQSQTTNVNINVGIAGRLEAARKRVSAAKVIEGKVEDGTEEG